MTAPNHNHAHWQARLDHIQQLLLDQFGISAQVCIQETPAASKSDNWFKDAKQTKITPIQYEANFPFKHNNFVYHLSLPVAISNIEEHGLKPGCVSIPPGTSEFIIRLSNPDAEGLYQESRVQNEVGMLTLASAALAHMVPGVVPRVFGWDVSKSTPEHPGWILQEMMPGLPLAEAFGVMDIAHKRGILAQMASYLFPSFFPCHKRGSET